MRTLARRAAYPAAFFSSLALLTAVALLGFGFAFADSALAGVGGLTPHSSSSTSTTESETGEVAAGPVSKAALVNGRAIAPINAPPAVKKVIAAANKIRAKPYIWGGGHGRWWDSGYDCSGAVSFALHGGKMLESPLPSGPMMTWGEAGAGRWITVYANAGHAYAVIAGLRFDTAGNPGSSGPRWSEDTTAKAGGRFVARHPTGY